MTARRILALVVAVVLVVTAIFVRRALTDDDAEGPGERSATETTAVCATVLATACREAGFAEVTSEDPGTTADRLARGEPLGADLWVAPEPWPEMVPVLADQANRAPVEAPVTEAVASTRLAIVGWADRVQVVEQTCGGTAGWRCLGDLAGRSWVDAGGQAAWGDVTVGVDPADTTSGLLTVAAATRGWFAAADPPVVDVATNDLDADDAYDDWLSGLARSSTIRSPGSGTALDRFVRTPAGASMVTALEADAKRVLSTAARNERFRLVVPEPVATTSVVVWGEGGSGVVDRLRSALEDRAWRDPVAQGATGLPRPGVMVQLRDRWNPPRS